MFCFLQLCKICYLGGYFFFTKTNQKLNVGYCIVMSDRKSGYLEIKLETQRNIGKFVVKCHSKESQQIQCRTCRCVDNPHIAFKVH